MKLSVVGCIAGVIALAGCASAPDRAAGSKAAPQTGPAQVAQAGGRGDCLLERQFVYEVLRHVYRWHFDQSYFLEPGNMETLEVWARRLHPQLDPDDRSEFAEFWIPAVKMQVELKRSDYRVAEMNLHVADRGFKVKRVTRQLRPPASRSHYEVGRYVLPDLREYLFATRTNRVALNDDVRAAGRRLVFEQLNKRHPAPFTEDQVLYIAPLSAVCNDLWVFWETGRKIMLFSADMDLTNPGSAELSQLRMQLIDLDKDVVASTKEVPGSNAFVTKDWVGRLFFNCILYGERVVRSPDELERLRK
jgi:hypothetical protein